MKRHATAEHLSSYLDSELEPDEARRLEGHLEVCMRCRRQLDGLRRVLGDLRSLRAGAPPAGLGLRLQQQIAREAPSPGERMRLGGRQAQPFFQPAVLGSLGVILALAVILLIFLQALEQRQAGDFVPGQSGRSVVGRPGVAHESLELAGRAFERLDGFWIERDLTVSEVAEAEVVDRDELLARVDLERDVRQILEVIVEPVVLRVGDRPLRVSAAPRRD